MLDYLIQCVPLFQLKIRHFMKHLLADDISKMLVIGNGNCFIKRWFASGDVPKNTDVEDFKERHVG